MSLHNYMPYAPAALMSSTHTPMDVKAVKIRKVESNDEHHLLTRKIKARTVRCLPKYSRAAGVSRLYEGDSDKFGECMTLY